MDLAQQGKLRDKKVLAEQAMRLLGTKDKASASLHNFMQQWLYIENLLEKDKDPELFSLYSKEVAADLAEESRLFLNSVIFDPGADRSFKTLFTGSYGFVNARTAPLYGIQNVTGNALTRTELQPDRAPRASSPRPPSWRATPIRTAPPWSIAAATSARRSCAPRCRLPPEGAAAALDPQFATADMTGREKFALHSTEPACAACHLLFDGLGFAMESYDAIGRFRTTDKGKPLDPSGSVPLPSDGTVARVQQLRRPGRQAVEHQGPLQLLLLAVPDLRHRPQARARSRSASGSWSPSEFEKSGYKLDALILSVINTPSFMARKN